VKLGVFSLWNGQQAFHSRPARMSFTDGAMIADKVVRARNSSSQAGERVTNRPYARFAASQYGVAELSTAQAGRKRMQSQPYPSRRFEPQHGVQETHQTHSCLIQKDSFSV
jgi:hypothetical protein